MPAGADRLGSASAAGGLPGAGALSVHVGTSRALPVRERRRGMRRPVVLHVGHADDGVAELDASLAAAEPAIAPRWLYDPLGCALFVAITALPEYAPTRAEREILHRHRHDIARHVPADTVLVDLGAGDCAKAPLLIDALAPAAYVAVDIAGEFLQASLARLQLDHPALDVRGVVADLSRPFDLAVPPGPRLLFYPGSSLGNFEPAQADAMLSRWRAMAGDDGWLLLGVDLVRDARAILPGYDDALGVTAAFSRNGLAHAARALDAQVRVDDWRHVATWDAAHARVSLYLEAMRTLPLAWDSRDGVRVERWFSPGERILVEHSHKYEPEGAAAMLRRAGFETVELWTDTRRTFAVLLARAA